MLLLLAACGDPVAVQDYLTVVHVAPSHGSANVAPETTISITFNDDLDEESVAGAVWIEDVTGTPIVSEVVYDAENTTLLMAPAEDLARDEPYDIVVTTGVEGLNFGALPGEISSSFWTVGAGPAGGNQAPVAIIAPNDADCAPGAAFSLVGEDSYDPEEEPLEYTWRIVDGQGGWVDLSNSENASLTSQSGGDFVIGLVVNDGELDSSEAFLVVNCDG